MLVLLLASCGGGEVYTYDVVLGKEQIFPLQMGNGTYTIKVMKNIVDTKYSELYCCTAEVDMADEFDPFLRPSQYADYNESSNCVKKAAEIAASSADANDFITGVYNYVCKNIKYDKKKAENIQSMSSYPLFRLKDNRLFIEHKKGQEKRRKNNEQISYT